MSGSFESLPMMLTLIFGTLAMPDNPQMSVSTSPNSKIQEYTARAALRDLYEAKTTRPARERTRSAGVTKSR